MVTCNCLPSCLSPLKGKVINFSGDINPDQVFGQKAHLDVTSQTVFLRIYFSSSLGMVSFALARALLQLSEVQDKDVTLTFSFYVLIHFSF